MTFPQGQAGIFLYPGSPTLRLPVISFSEAKLSDYRKTKER